MWKSLHDVFAINRKALGFILFCLLAGYGMAQEVTADSANQGKTGFIYEFGAEYLVPTRFSNKVKTISLNAFFWKKYFKNISVLFSVGMTGTYGWGDILRSTKVSNTRVEITSHKTSAFGIGPVLQTQFAPIVIKRFSVILEISGGFILYANPFPYGGDYYNFMLRTGPSLAYKFKNNSSLKIGYRWMHVSNGKGNGIQNPFYEAYGLNISFILVK